MLLLIVCHVFTRDIAILLGATEDLLEPCVIYGRILLVALVPFMLQNVFQSFLVTAEKPKLGLIVTVVVGVTNMILDFLLIGVIRGGVVGAALATGISQVVGGVVPLVYFARENSSQLRLVKSKVNFRALGKTCFNGASELMTNISMSLVSMLYNLQLLKYAGENGIAAYGVIMYVIAIGMASLLAGIFVGYDETLYEMTRRGFIFYSLSFVVMGVNIYGSSFFTALSNGLVSAVISFLRTLLFQMLAVLVLPLLLGLDGIWISVVVAEIMALAVTVFFFVTKKKQYGY